MPDNRWSHLIYKALWLWGKIAFDPCEVVQFNGSMRNERNVARCRGGENGFVFVNAGLD